MLKCDVLNKTKVSGINFENLPTRSTFVVLNADGSEWIGMKVATAISDEEQKCYVLDLSGECGYLYDDIDMYNIVRLIDLKVVEDED